MKKILMSLVLVLGVFSSSVVSASAAMNFDQLIYQDKENANKYYSLAKNTYLINVANKKVKDFNFKYVRLTNGKYYAKNTYLITVAQESRNGLTFSETMEKLAAKTNQTVTNIEAGKVANDGTVIASSAQDNTVAPEPEVREFKVIDIK